MWCYMNNFMSPLFQSRRFEPDRVQVPGVDRLPAERPHEPRARRRLGHPGRGVPARRREAQDGPGQEVPGPASKVSESWLWLKKS